ncbi:hypothetical protein SAMN02744133_10311 [Thalassospira xiamenensis M-5 = DSM 17429]|nr:hypothetical protein SAMN02744133_10311 [Thalassospira xiamenensis M-5 = DSM 17429]
MNSAEISSKQMKEILSSIRKHHLALEEDGSNPELLASLRHIEDDLGSLQGRKFRIQGTD